MGTGTVKGSLLATGRTSWNCPPGEAENLNWPGEKNCGFPLLDGELLPGVPELDLLVGVTEAVKVFVGPGDLAGEWGKVDGSWALGRAGQSEGTGHFSWNMETGTLYWMVGATTLVSSLIAGPS